MTKRQSGNVTLGVTLGVILGVSVSVSVSVTYVWKTSRALMASLMSGLADSRRPNCIKPRNK